MKQKRRKSFQCSRATYGLLAGCCHHRCHQVARCSCTRSSVCKTIPPSAARAPSRSLQMNSVPCSTHWIKRNEKKEEKKKHIMFYRYTRPSNTLPCLYIQTRERTNRDPRAQQRWRCPVLHAVRASATSHPARVRLFNGAAFLLSSFFPSALRTLTRRHASRVLLSSTRAIIGTAASHAVPTLHGGIYARDRFVRAA